MPENESKCRACGVRIIFAISPAGKTIPLTRIRNVYRLNGEDAEVIGDFGQLARYVSHFETCPQAGRFSKKRATT